MKFSYQARTKSGDIKSGIIEASSKEVALTLLQKMNLFVTFLEEEKPPLFLREIKIFRGISIRDLVLFFRQLAILINSKVPIVESLSTLAVQTKNLFLKEAILDIAHEVETGSSLAKAFLKYKDIFSPFEIAMIRAGEVSGKLSESLNYLADHLENDYNLKSKTKGVLIYPAIILILFFAIFFVTMFTVIPTFENLFAERAVEIPLFTKIVINLSHFIRENLFLLILFLTIPGIILWRYFSTEGGKEIIDRFSLRLPFFGEIIKKTLVVRFSENLATLTSAGLMITEALEIVEGILGNVVFQELVSEIKNGVKKGLPISSISALYPEYFPPLFTQMALVGEKTGSLSSCFLIIASFYRKEIERSIENFFRVLEPLLILVLGVLVGGLMATILIPLYRIITTG